MTFDTYRAEQSAYYMGRHLGPRVFANECFKWLAMQDVAVRNDAVAEEEVCTYMYETMQDIARMQYACEEEVSTCDAAATYLHMAHTLALSKLVGILMHHEAGYMRINYDAENTQVASVHMATDSSIGNYLAGQSQQTVYLEGAELYVQATTPAVLQPYEVADLMDAHQSFDTSQFVTLTPRVKTTAWGKGYIGHNARWN